MDTHKPKPASAEARIDYEGQARPLYWMSTNAAGAGLGLALLLGLIPSDYFRRFLFAYLTGFMFFLSIGLGGLFFVLLQHVTRAGWSVNVRRIAEWFSTTLPIMGILAIPIVLSVLIHPSEGGGLLYGWAAKDWGGAKMNGFKIVYLNTAFFIFRVIVYFLIWSGISLWFWRQSLLQDVTGDVAITERMQAVSAPCMVLFGITLTLAAIDLVMALDPTWFSTIFGVYYFAGCVLAIFSSIVLTVLVLQSRGYLVDSVTIEHFHDLGKFMFAFTFFWGYIAFSQYMLQWYANIPEETEWFRRRGATTAFRTENGWSYVILMLLFGHLLIPFAGLLSRHVKRNRIALGFWAAWILAFCWLDLLWMIRPNMRLPDGTFPYFDLGLIDLAVFVGIGGVFLATVIRRMSHGALRPLQDPRASDSFAFENI